MEFPLNIITNTENETIETAQKFSAFLNIGDVVTLSGDLGAGKTLFVKGVCGKYNIHNVTSPTFALVNEYSNGKKIYHFDFYRIEKINELYDIGFEDYITDNDAVLFIEWADIFPEIIPGKRYDVSIEILDEKKRKIEIKKYE
jgi:tRNA threonylcarbamoyladenosine biosynthesis protein TsaE